MALGATGAAIAGGLASGAASAGLGAITSRGSSSGGLGRFTSPGFSAGGLRSYQAGNNIVVRSLGGTRSVEDIDAEIQRLDRLRRAGGDQSVINPQINELISQRDAASANRPGLVDSVAGLFREQAGEIRGLRGLVRPGFGRLTESRVQAVQDARRRSVGNLREGFSRRRVLGSSFAQDAESRAEAEFAKTEADVRARSFLEELELTNALISQEFDAGRAEFQTRLDELNLQIDVASQLATGATSQLGANARLQAELSAEEAAGRGRFFGQAFQPAISAFGQGVGDFFGSGSAAPSVTVPPITGPGLSSSGQVTGLF